jgi:hypothetical protein
MVPKVVKGKVAKVDIWTERYRIQGSLHIPQKDGYKSRLSDLLNKYDTTFLALTDVTLCSLITGDVAWQGSFLAVNKSSIVLVQAVDE